MKCFIRGIYTQESYYAVTCALHVPLVIAAVKSCIPIVALNLSQQHGRFASGFGKGYTSQSDLFSRKENFLLIRG